MRSIRRIVESYRSVGERGPSATLATVVAADGPGHPGIGSRMLLIEGGHHSGLIGSDALHHELHEAARQADAKHLARTLGFSTVGSHQLAGGDGTGQTVEVLLEPLTGRADEGAIRVLEHCLDQRVAVLQATVFAASSQGPAELGQRLALDERGALLADTAPKDLRGELERALGEVTPTAETRTVRVGPAQAPVDVLVERIEPPVGLLIFGGGLDACPLVKFAHELGWSVRVIDPDPARANAGRFPLADEVVVARPDQVTERVPVDRRSAAVVMTHNPEHDRALLAELRETPASYLGFAPRDYDPRLLIDDAEPPKAERVFVPAGMEIGAVTAHETAVAILAQIIRYFSGATA